MLRKTIVGAFVMAAAAGVLAAAPAQANPSPAGDGGVAAPRYINLGESDNCPDGYFCAIEDVYLLGNGVAFLYTEPNWRTIPTQYRWISNRARSGTNHGIPGALDDVVAYPLPGFRSDPRWPAACVPNNLANTNWGALRPESNKWVNAC